VLDDHIELLIPGCAAIITSRAAGDDNSDGATTTSVPIGPLTTAEATTLFPQAGRPLLGSTGTTNSSTKARTRC
jgi:hypothetical protein